jgi:hypothetical protein
MAMPYEGDSSDPHVPGLKGVSHAANGGVVGVNDWAAAGQPPGTGGNGGWFESAQGEGVRGWSKNPNHGGVVGVNTAGGIAVFGTSDSGSGVVGKSDKWIAIFGESTNSEGVRGLSHSPHGGVVGINDAADPATAGNGGWFESAQGEGVRGWSKNPNHGGVVGVNTAGGTAVFGTSDNAVGVWGTSINFEGVHAETQSPTTAAVAAYNLNPNGTGAAVFGKKAGNQGFAGFFEGNVWISGVLDVGKDITLANADCAEDFTIGTAAPVEPGTVMVVGEEGSLYPSAIAYDKRVAGIVSGAGGYKPGIILDKQKSFCNRQPIALLGKVFCKVDARHGAIEIGDLLTTSPTLGHAMKADDPLKAFGAVIGKALRSIKEGKGLIPILIALQ